MNMVNIIIIIIIINYKCVHQGANKMTNQKLIFSGFLVINIQMLNMDITHLRTLYIAMIKYKTLYFLFGTY